MIFIENILICMAAPLIVAMFCVGRRYRYMLGFLLYGMMACLIAAYGNTFFSQYYQIPVSEATLQITPVVEELVKFAGVLYYLFIFEPSKEQVKNAVLMTGMGFATFENVCYMVGNGSESLWNLLLRGFGAGAMHIVCGNLIAFGIFYAWKSNLFRVAGTMGLMSLAITFHAFYNLFIYAGDILQKIGFVFPILTLIITYIVIAVMKHYRIISNENTL